MLPTPMPDTDSSDLDRQPAAGLGPLELLVLLHPNRPAGSHLAQLALAPLLTSGALTVERTSKKTLGFRHDDVRLRPTGKPAPGPSGAYAAALDALTATRVPEAGLAPTDAASRLQQRLGIDYGKLLSAHARPLLVERGLIERHERVRLRFFRSARYVHTASGAAAREALEAWVRRADRVPALMKESLPGAAAYAAGLGVAVLLSDVARPHIGHLAKAARAQGLSNPTSAPPLERLGDPGTGVWVVGADGSGDLGGLEGLGDLDAGTFWDALGDLGDVGGFDGGSSDGGGDGGGVD